MDKKPNNIVFGINEKPPLKYLLALAFQHMLIPLMFLTYPILVARELAQPFGATVNFVSMSILCLGIGTIVQCSRNWVGSGLLAVHQPSPIYLPAYSAAAQAGGLGLASVFTFLGGLVQITMGRSLRHISKIFSEEVCGVAIFMLGVSMVPSAMKLFFGLDKTGGTISLPGALIAAVTLSLIVITSSSRKHIRFYSLLIGCAGGYLLAVPLNMFPEGALANLGMVSWFALPSVGVPSFTFNMELLPIFVITAAIASIDTLGGMITIDKMNQPDWKKQNVELSARGVQTEGFMNLINGLFCAYPGGVSSSNIGVSFATAVTSRYVGIATGIILICLAFSPKLAALLSIIPLPVIGAFLMYASAFLICSGMDLILIRSLNTHKIFIVGLSVVGGIGCGAFAQLTGDMPGWLRLMLGSPLTVATIIAITLTLLFKIGGKSAMTFKYRKHADFDIRKCIDVFSANVTLKSEIISSAHIAIDECIEALTLSDSLKSDWIDITLSYTETEFIAALKYIGTPLDTELKVIDINNLEDQNNAVQLALLLMRHHAKNIEVKADGETSTVIFSFER